MKPIAKRLSAGIFGAAVAIALVTMAARAVGFLRTVVLGQTLGADCLGSAYTTANAVPNVVFEVVAGGALAGAVVPLLAGAVARADRQTVTATVSALTGWVLLLLLPAAFAVAVFASPIIDLLTGGSGGCDAGQVRRVATSMLVIFAVQIPVYGLTVVAQGALQAHHRFLSPALAPLVSSLVVVTAYGLYWVESGATRGSISALSDTGLALLAWGTTLGVVALWLTQWPGMKAERLLVLKPRLRFPDGVAVRARKLAAAGAVTVAAQWIAFAVALRVANDRGLEGAALVYTLAWTVFLLPWAVLALPVATSAFPRFSSMFDSGESESFAVTAASTTRAVMVAGGLGVAGVIATAEPVANLMLLDAPGPDQTGVLAHTLVAFAPAVLGYALAGHISRMFYARHQGGLAALLVGGGWLLGTAVAVSVASTVDATNVVVALGVGASVGMLVAGVFALIVMHSVVGHRSVHGLFRTSVGTLVAVAVSSAVGLGLAAAIPDSSRWLAGLSAVSVSVVVVATFAGAVALVDRDAVAVLFTRIRESRGRGAA